MATSNRVGTAVFLMGGLALALFMGYTLWHDFATTAASSPGSLLQGTAEEVAVVLPERDDWQSFRQAVLTCSRRGLLAVEHDYPTELIVNTPRRGVAVRFAWHRASGRVSTRSMVNRFSHSSGPPRAVIGSINTAQTVALAEALAANYPDDTDNGPVLLVPWATAGLTPSRRPGQPNVPLLQIYPGRTFRFSSNNFAQAELVTHCVLAHDQPPGRVLIVVDRADPYSVDLASAFEQVVRSDASVEDVRVIDDLSFSPGLSDVPGAPEIDAAARLWALAAQPPANASTWLVLPLQTRPTGQLLAALKSHAPAVGRPKLEIVCGDGSNVEALQRFTRTTAFSVWCTSSDLAPQVGEDLPRDVLVPAEIVSALIYALDREEEGAIGLRDAIRSINLDESDPESLGRSISLDENGERKDPEVGIVLHLRAGHGEIVAYAPKAKGSWAPPVVVPLNPMLAEP